MVDLIMSMQNGSPIILRGEEHGHAGFFRLAALMGLSPWESNPTVTPNLTIGPPCHTSDSSLADYQSVVSSSRLEVNWDRKSGSFQMADRLEEIPDDQRLIHLWQWATALGPLATILRGKKIALVHGAILVSSQGGVLICGESGVGKSTTAKRWRQFGYEAPADDLVLLEFVNDKVWAHPMPTWSFCRISLDQAFFQFQRTIPLIGVLCLGRGHNKEELRSITQAECFAQLYRSIFYHLLWIAQRLPLLEQTQLIFSSKLCAEDLSTRFPRLGLFAHLDGNLQQTLKDYL